MENDDYKAGQAGSQEEKVKRAKEEREAKIAKAKDAGRDDPGSQFKSTRSTRLSRRGRPSSNQLPRPLTECHVEQEIDLVTNVAVKECKQSANAFDHNQSKRVTEIQKKCFPDKQVKCVTTKLSWTRPASIA